MQRAQCISVCADLRSMQEALLLSMI
jgi:hypothetical protein